MSRGIGGGRRMKKNTLKDWANALHLYVAFPKRWPDENEASFLHAFFGKPIMGNDGDWIKDENGNGQLFTSFYVGESMDSSTLSISPEDSLTAPDKHLKNYLMEKIDPQTIANLMNMYLVKTSNGDLMLYKHKPELIPCFKGCIMPFPDRSYNSFNWDESDFYTKSLWRDIRNSYLMNNSPLIDDWFAPGYRSTIPGSFNIEKKDYKNIPYTEFIFEPEN